MAAVTARQIHVIWRRQYAGPGVQCRMDYCNSLLLSITNDLMSRLQSGFQDGHPGLYLSLSGIAPAYLAADCQLVSDEGRRQLVLVTQACVVRRTYSSYGAAMDCLAAGGPKLWKSSSSSLRQTDINFEQFKWLLKTFLFGCWDRGALWLTVKLHFLSILLTYLLSIYLLTRLYALYWQLKYDQQSYLQSLLGHTSQHSGGHLSHGWLWS